MEEIEDEMERICKGSAEGEDGDRDVGSKRFGNQSCMLTSIQLGNLVTRTSSEYTNLEQNVPPTCSM